MALKAVLDSLDSVDAAFHDLYAEKDGKFVLQVEGIREHPDTLALSNALARVRAEKSDLATRLAEAEGRLEGLPDDFSADVYEELKAQAEAGDGKSVDEQVTQAREQGERKLAAAERKAAAEIAKRDEAIARQEATIQRTVFEGGLSSAMDEANIDPRHKKKLAPYLRSLGKFKVVEDEGAVAAVVETDMGEVSITKFVADWAASDDGKEYVGRPAGLDARGGDQRRLEGNPFAKAGWNKTEQGRLMTADRAKAERMAKAAGFAGLDAAARAREPIAA